MAQIPFGYFSGIISYKDPKYFSVNLDVNGIVTTFEENIDDKTKSDLKSALTTALMNALDSLSSEGVSYPRLLSKIPDIQSMIREELKNSGFDVMDVVFNQFGPDDKSKARIADLERATMFASNPQLLAQMMAEGEKAHMAAVSASEAPTPSAPVASAKFCRNCGSPAGDGKFCTSCGSLLNP